MIKVLFVCLGNICRSPMAESIFRHKVVLSGLEDEISTDSAATGSWEVGSLPHEGTRNVLKKNNILCTTKKARKLTKTDLEDFDYIVAMDDENFNNIISLNESLSAKIYMLSAFVEGADWKSVPDPWYTKDFDYTYELLDKGCEGILKDIVSKW